MGGLNALPCMGDYEGTTYCQSLQGDGSQHGCVSRQPEMVLGTFVGKRQKSAGNNESSLALEPMGRPSEVRNKGYQPHKMDLGPIEKK